MGLPGQGWYSISLFFDQMHLCSHCSEDNDHVLSIECFSEHAGHMVELMKDFLNKCLHCRHYVMEEIVMMFSLNIWVYRQ